MLAFTMQFSRYGRNRTYSAPIQGLFGQAASNALTLHLPEGINLPATAKLEHSRVSVPQKRLLPQDPTACSFSQAFEYSNFDLPEKN